MVEAVTASRTSSGGVGYTLVQCSRAKGTPAARMISTAGRTVSIEFIPVLRIIGRPNPATCLMSG